ncbi:thermonuclease family protein [Nitratidesulfovibrio sp. SRB-5]|uniref:thermonuclease family protein n=1 Tax=Nitratidesulfovibrio sp. SRB-5 TaxID=2872636 RepID=UPI001CBA6AF1|nr:thermonuclease family protein [Nitratidesulfovibrio sp. SRB-5]
MRRTLLARMLRAGLLALPLLFPPLLADTGGFACRAGETFGDARAVVLRVPDGDTLVVDIPGYPPVAGRAISVRIAGCDTPEKRDPRAELRELSRRARELTLHMAAPGSTVTLRNLRRDKYFRLLADVEADGGDIASALIERGLAKPYEGGRKEW